MQTPTVTVNISPADDGRAWLDIQGAPSFEVIPHVLAQLGTTAVAPPLLRLLINDKALSPEVQGHLTELRAQQNVHLIAVKWAEFPVTKGTHPGVVGKLVRQSDGRIDLLTGWINHEAPHRALFSCVVKEGEPDIREEQNGNKLMHAWGLKRLGQGTWMVAPSVREPFHAFLVLTDVPAEVEADLFGIVHDPGTALGFAQADVAEFHHIGGHVVNTQPTIPDESTVKLRTRLIREEAEETCAAIERGDLAEIADGIADSIYVLLGTAVSYGIDMEPVWRAVAAANLAKFPTCPACEGRANVSLTCDTCKGAGRIVLRDAGGKTIKPEGWQPPDIAGVLAAQKLPDAPAVPDLLASREERNLDAWGDAFDHDRSQEG